MSKLVANQDKINQDLAVLIDQDLKQEQALLKALIEEILKANEKIKNAHFERVEDTEAKLKVLNAEIRKIRKNIRAQDDIVLEKRLTLLKETKKDYFHVVSELRLKDVKEHFTQPLKKHLKNLSESLVSEVKTYLPNRIKDFQTPIQDFFSALQAYVQSEREGSFLKLQAQADLYPNVSDQINDAVQPLKPLILAFKKHLETNLEKHIAAFDTSELDELLKDIEDTTQQDLKLIDEQMTAVDEALADDLKQMDDAFKQEKKAVFNAYVKELPSDLDKTDSDRLNKALNDLQKQIDKARDKEALSSLEKEYKKIQADYFKTPVGKMAKKVEKEFKGAEKKHRKDKIAKQNEHLEQTYELKMQSIERSMQCVIDGASLKLRTAIDRLEASETTYHQTIDLFEKYLLDIFQFEKSMRQLLANLQSKKVMLHRHNAELNLLKEAYLQRYKKIVQRLEIQTLQAIEERQKDFQKLQVKLNSQLEKERLEIVKLYGLTKIIDQRLRLVNRAKVAKLDEIQSLKFQIFQDEADIKLAEKEYDIQVLKAQSVYDHERAINKVQTERIDAGVHVNKAMVQATVKRQVNFADQQIRFADAELAARLEHIEYTLQQELSYTEETLGHHEKAYEQARSELELDYQSKKQSIEQKKKLFQHSTMLNKVLQEEADLEMSMEEKRQAFEDKVAHDINIHRYREQIAKAKEHAEASKADAMRLHDQDVASFEALKQESLERLANVENMMAEPNLLPYHQEQENDIATQRLQEMLDSAEIFLHEKLKTPKQRIEESQKRLLALEKESASSQELNELLLQENELQESYLSTLETLSDKAERDIAAIDQTFQQSKASSQPLIDRIDQELSIDITLSEAQLKDLEHREIKTIKTIESQLERELRDIDAKEDEWIIDLKRTQDDAIRDRLDLSVSLQMKVEKIEGYLKPAIDESFKSLNRKFKKEKY